MTAPVVPQVVHRLRVLVACLLLVALAFSQSAGQLVADTKLDLAVAPLRFLGRALHLWDPQGAFGQLQNQAYGYLFPMGPFFALGELLAAPGWVTQRLWLSLVLVTALLGAQALARELGIGTPPTQLLAGVAYALSPRVLTVGGPISIEAWPLAVLPWVLVPLVRGARGGSVRRAAALSGVAVLCIGGVNAAATLAVLPLAGLFLLTRLGSARGRRLAGWWALAVPLATLWWVLPLVLLGRYSPPFLDYIETAATTTSRTSLVEVLRGTSHWLAYLVIGDGPWWRAGWELVTDPVLIAATALVAALGLAGLLRRDVPERVFLLSGVLLGTLLVTAGHVGALPGWLEPPLAAPLRELLDGPLAPFRNVHKFDAVLRLPLVLGLAHLAASVRLRRVEDLSNGLPAGLRPFAARPVALLAAVGLLVGATPLLTGSLAPRGAFTAFPEAWPAVARWLEDQGQDGRALIVPGAPFGEYVWGRPLDEPLQPLAGSPWAVRNAVPLGTEGNTRLLDAVEEQLESGRGSAGLAELLRRAGVSHVVVRNDLDWLSAGASWPYLAERALVESPGLRSVKEFGSRDDRIPSLEVFAVGDPLPPVATYAADSLVRLSGGPESLLDVAEAAPGLLRDRPVVLAGEDAPEAAVAVVTDGSRRREVDFGRVRGGSSATLGVDERLRLDRPAADLVVVPGTEHRTTAVYDGVRDVRASSSAADAGSLRPADRSRQPSAAVDGDPRTAWLPQDGPTDGEWLELVLDRPAELRSVVLAPLLERLPSRAGDGPAGVAATLRVTTDAGSREVRVDAQTTTLRVDLPPGPTGRVRVTFDDLESGLLRVGLAELDLPGVEVRRVLAAPADAAQAPDVPVAVVLSRTGDGRAGCTPVPGGGFCTDGLLQVGEEPGALERSFATTTSTEAVLLAAGRPVPGPALDALLAGARGDALRIRVLPDEQADPAPPPPPLAGPAMALDRRPDSFWLVPPTGARLELSWDGPRDLTQLRLDLDEAPGDGPFSIGLTALLGGRVQPTAFPEVGFSSAGTADLAVRADRIVLAFPEGDGVLRVRELELAGLADLVTAALPRERLAVRVPCGQGPSVELDGRVVDTSVSTTYGALERLEQVALQPCDGQALPLAAGEHRLTGRGTGALQVDSVLLRDVRLDGPGAAGAREVDTVEQWGQVDRRLTVTAGAATYLAVKENANDGWQATLDGRPLPAQRLDGWQQGWLLPAGAAGTVELVYAPDRGFRLGLLGGLAAALVLLGLAAVRPHAGSPLPPSRAPRGGRVTALVGAGAVVLLGGLAGALAVGAGLAARRRGWGGAVVLAAVGLAGLLVAVRPWPDPSAGADSAVPQLLVLLALGAAAAALLGPRPAREPAVDEL